MLGNTPVGDTIQHMWDQEKVHLATFNSLIPHHRARPTILLPFWHLAGFALGAGTALLGKEGAMACTVAVEVNTIIIIVRGGAFIIIAMSGTSLLWQISHFSEL